VQRHQQIIQKAAKDAAQSVNSGFACKFPEYAQVWMGFNVDS
jgi:hypothetical protein